MNGDRTAAIEAVLVETENAHAAYENAELGGVYDQAWPQWYASYAVDHGLPAILGRSIDADALADYLVRTWDEATRSGAKPAEPWSRWMAGRIAAEL
jgi:hypothetical protein